MPSPAPACPSSLTGKASLCHSGLTPSAAPSVSKQGLITVQRGLHDFQRGLHDVQRGLNMVQHGLNVVYVV